MSLSSDLRRLLFEPPPAAPRRRKVSSEAVTEGSEASSVEVDVPPVNFQDVTAIVEGAQSDSFLRLGHTIPRPRSSRSMPRWGRSSSSKGSKGSGVGRLLPRSMSLSSLSLSSRRSSTAERLSYPAATASASAAAGASAGGEGELFDDLRCLSVLTPARSVDLIAPTNRLRDDWRWALEMLHVHWASDDELQTVAAQRKALGVDVGFCAKHTYLAADVLGQEYVALEVQVNRSSEGLGIVMDAANNTIVEVESDSPAEAAGLREHDLIAVVDGNAVTVLENGYILPRSTVTAAIDPSQPSVRLTLFRKFVREPPGMRKSSSAQKI